MKKKLYYIQVCVVLAIFVILSIGVIIAFINDNNHASLEKIYFTGGIVSGIFAFGAFIVAMRSNNTQRMTSEIQRFESTFFNMLSLQQQIVSDLSRTDVNKEIIEEDAPTPDHGSIKKEVLKDINIKGRELFNYYFCDIQIPLDKNRYVYGMRELISIKGLGAYAELFFPTYFDHYFMHLYTIIKFADSTSFLSGKEKYKYTSMVRASLSRFELIWLYYYCLSSVGNEKFKPLIEKYALLKNLRKELLALSNENRVILQQKGLEQKLEESGFSQKDYEFYLTNEQNKKSAYYIGAFYNYDKRKEGENLVNTWNDFINSAG